MPFAFRQLCKHSRNMPSIVTSLVADARGCGRRYCVANGTQERGEEEKALGRGWRFAPQYIMMSSHRVVAFLENILLCIHLRPTRSNLHQSFVRFVYCCGMAMSNPARVVAVNPIETEEIRRFHLVVLSRRIITCRHFSIYLFKKSYFPLASVLAVPILQNHKTLYECLLSFVRWWSFSLDVFFWVSIA